MKRRLNWTVFLVQAGIVALFLAAWELAALTRALDRFSVSWRYGGLDLLDSDRRRD